MTSTTTLKPVTGFAGVISNDIKDFKDKQDMIFQQKMLKAYIQGAEAFRWGYRTTAEGLRVPAWFEVKRRVINKN